MKSAHIVYSALLGFTLGVAWRSFVDLGISFSLFIVLLGGVLGGIVFLHRKQMHAYMRMFMIAILFLSLGLGMLRYDLSNRKLGDPVLDAVAENHVTLEGIIVSEPAQRETSQRIVVAIDTLEIAYVWKGS